jgi:predicted RNA-binding Zn ribbon-like protein
MAAVPDPPTGTDPQGRPGKPQDVTEAGHPFLAFVNTVSDPGKTRMRDDYGNGADLLRILRDAGLVTALDAPGPAQSRDLRTFREAAYAVLSAIAARRTPPREEALTVELAIKVALADARLSYERHGPRWQSGPLGGLQDDLALSLADLLGSGELHRLRECRRCTHLFLDHGRGPGRRWCSMARCGNRAKAESFRARQRRG